MEHVEVHGHVPGERVRGRLHARCRDVGEVDDGIDALQDVDGLAEVGQVRVGEGDRQLRQVARGTRDIGGHDLMVVGDQVRDDPSPELPVRPRDAHPHPAPRQQPPGRHRVRLHGRGPWRRGGCAPATIRTWQRQASVGARSWASASPRCSRRTTPSDAPGAVSPSAALRSGSPSWMPWRSRPRRRGPSARPSTGPAPVSHGP